MCKKLGTCYFQQYSFTHQIAILFFDHLHSVFRIKMTETQAVINISSFQLIPHGKAHLSSRHSCLYAAIAPKGEGRGGEKKKGEIHQMQHPKNFAFYQQQQQQKVKA